MNILQPEARLLPKPVWWLILALIVLSAAVFRYTGYDYSLPYIDHPDEPAYLLAARMVIDFGSAHPLGMHGYPPGLIAVNYMLLRYFQPPDTPVGILLGPARLISITVSLVGIALLGLIGWRMASPLAGWLTAALWAWSPTIIQQNLFATADNYVTVFALGAFFLILTGTRFNRRGWLYTGLISLLLAIVFKYQAVFVLPLLFIVPLWRLRDHSLPRGPILAQFGRSILIVGLFTFWLIVLFPALEVTSSPYFSAPSSRLGIPSPQTLFENSAMVLGLIVSNPIWWLGWAGLALLLLKPVREQVRLFETAVVALGAAMWLFGVSLYGVLGSQELRQFMTFAALMTALCGFGLNAWAVVLCIVLQRVNLSQASAWAAGGAALVVLLLHIPAFQEAAAMSQQRLLSDRRNDLASWMDRTLEPGGYIATVDNHKTFNREWGGYGGANDFPFIENALLDQRSIAEWRDLGAEYAIMPGYSYAQWQASEDGQAMLSEALLLKTYPPSSAYRGPDMVVLRLAPIQHRIEAAPLGPITVLGYDLDASGRTYDARLYWRAAEPTAAEYRVFNHLIDVDTGELVAQTDGPPLADVRRPTSDWNDPEEVIVSQPFQFVLDELEAGRYEWITGFYRPDTGERLLSADGGSAVTVTTLEVR